MTYLIRVLTVTAALGLAAAGCGESSEEKAQNQVCDARADIQKQVNELSTISVTTATVNGVKENLNAIGDDLEQIKDAESDLSDERRQQVESASQTFGSEVQSIVKNLGTTLSAGAAKSELQSSLKQLAQSYERALAPIDCG